mmetsp:Transcript_26831/g.81206  ORF Transcript_26831/g.81206 Transcript_26831/m.81206 type:complete len:306 (-) Transcript_26831:115-1032(-)
MCWHVGGGRRFRGRGQWCTGGRRLICLATTAIPPSTAACLRLRCGLLLREELTRKSFQERIIIKKGQQPAAQFNLERNNIATRHAAVGCRLRLPWFRSTLRGGRGICGARRGGWHGRAGCGELALHHGEEGGHVVRGCSHLARHGVGGGRSRWGNRCRRRLGRRVNHTRGSIGGWFVDRRRCVWLLPRDDRLKEISYLRTLRRRVEPDADDLRLLIAVKKKLISEFHLKVCSDGLHYVLAREPVEHHKHVARLRDTCNNKQRALNLLEVPRLCGFIVLVQDDVSGHINHLRDFRIAPLEHGEIVL